MTKNSYDNQEDLVWAMAIGRGDQQALAKLYDKYAPALTGVIRRIVHKDEATDEVLQKVFQLVWNEAGLFDASKHSLFTWLIKISRHTAIDTLRSAAAETPATTHIVYTYTDNNHEAGGKEPFERQTFDLLYYKGLTCPEAAAAMNIPAVEVKKYVRLAIKNMERLPIE